MKLTYFIDNCSLIFTETQTSRIKSILNADNDIEAIIVDVHGMSCYEAKRFINNIINVTRGHCCLKVIHGYRHGTKIKQMLQERFFNPWIQAIVSDKNNMGVTYLQTVAFAG